MAKKLNNINQLTFDRKWNSISVQFRFDRFHANGERMPKSRNHVRPTCYSHGKWLLECSSANCSRNRKSAHIIDVCRLHFFFCRLPPLEFEAEKKRKPRNEFNVMIYDDGNYQCKPKRTKTKSFDVCARKHFE